MPADLFEQFYVAAYDDSGKTVLFWDVTRNRPPRNGRPRFGDGRASTLDEVTDAIALGYKIRNDPPFEFE